MIGIAIIPQSYECLKLIIKDLIGPDKKVQGILILVREPAMLSEEYRKIIASHRKCKDIHIPTN